MFAALGSHAWAYPMLEVVHLIGVALILGNLVLAREDVGEHHPAQESLMEINRAAIRARHQRQRLIEDAALGDSEGQLSGIVVSAIGGHDWPRT